jgi:hypothetical protein
MIGLVHLVWAPLGPEPLREFLSSYHAHPAGVEHELTIVLNGPSRDDGVGTRIVGDGQPKDADEVKLWDAGAARHAGKARSAGEARLYRSGGTSERDRLLAELDGIEHRLLVLDRPVTDLAAYGLAAQALSHPRLCFLNSYSVVLADGWLAMLARGLDGSNVGLAGATASWETQARWIRGKARYWPYQLARLRRMRRDYPHFPNPHIRTTTFMIEREMVVDLKLEDAHDKRSTYLLESGRNSITRQILQRGLRTVVAGRDGNTYGIKNWAVSRTYRSGEQDNLLVADRRTRDWQRASPRLRRRLSRDAWGEHYIGPGGVQDDGS